MEWNDLTSTIALAIDNNPNQLAFALNTVERWDVPSKTQPEFLVSVAEALRDHYSTNLERICNSDGKNFLFSLAGMLLNQSLAEIQWKELAEHYITKYLESQDND